MKLTTNLTIPTTSLEQSIETTLQEVLTQSLSIQTTAFGMRISLAPNWFIDVAVSGEGFVEVESSNIPKVSVIAMQRSSAKFQKTLAAIINKAKTLPL